MTISTDIKTDFHFRKPTKDDGAAVWELIKDTGVLDLNSSYSYLMWCEIFSETSIVADTEEGTVGFISGFIHPDHPKTLFIWQVAVNESERGKGLGTKMLFQLLQREACEHVAYIEATVSPSNTPSQQLFKGLAKKLDTNCKIDDYFSADDFPQEGHEDELLFKIGPFQKNKWIRMIE
ncbi:diaminobutyrate acetyltransferase [Virgibacillus halodenitrificans]|uniref:diaminobutyrate acetyltransferase n=1 Tax=Virgibacillus halodenitrificans TaxID=1482 RepID=UPI002DBB90F8|nr:diaminobutyrate acetyltransferase [Virgibacillus halodenitrificans]MEC2158502.1 diaminobutyrate acetyltransferase [Virgibacillus halodenitrificans]